MDEVINRLEGQIEELSTELEAEHSYEELVDISAALIDELQSHVELDWESVVQAHPALSGVKQSQALKLLRMIRLSIEVEREVTKRQQ